MEKIAFLLAPFDSYMDPETRIMYPDKIELIQTIEHRIQANGYKVYNAHRREDYGRALMEPEECTPLDLEHTKDSDVIVAIPGSPASGGVHIELGWASAFSKKIILLLEKEKNYSHLAHGLRQIAEVHYLWFDKIEDIVESEGALDSLEALL